jgi:hypothetical protein
MPGGNRRGPMNQGPQTGRGMGFCSGYAAPGYNSGYQGFGFGAGGFGRGGGFRHRRFQGFSGRFGGWGLPAAYPTPDPEIERRTLKEEADALRRQLHEVERRLTALEGSGRAEE